MALLPFDEALARLVGAVAAPKGSEQVPLAEAAGRTLAADLAALRTQPPFAASAMDGYAVRAADLSPDRALAVIGLSAAGHGFAGRLGPGQAVRIFTGAPLPEGADTILIQENAVAAGPDAIRPTQAEPAGRFVRPAGLDFSEGEVLLRAGTVLEGRHVALAASMDHAALPVRRRPVVAVLSTGDELVLPGAPRGPDQIVASNNLLASFAARAAGAEARDLGIVADDPAATTDAINRAVAAGADIVLTSGGASVGDHDHVQEALRAAGFSIDFWKIAMRPGKPLMFGRAGEVLALGLPGNPVSSAVCCEVFLKPLIKALLGHADAARLPFEDGVLGGPLPANDERAELMRARLAREGDRLVATPFPKQDSSIFRLFVEAEALVWRPVHAPPAPTGEPCRLIRL